MRAFNDVDLHAFVDGQCSTDRQAAIAAYLVTAPGDAARVAAWRRQKKVIKDLFAAAATEPVPLWLTVGQIAPARPANSNPTARTEPVPLRAVAAKSVPARRSGGANVWGVALMAFAAGVSATTLAVRLDSWLRPALSAPAVAEPFLDRAREAQSTFGSDPDRPVEVADVPPGRVQSWLDARLPFRARAPDLSASGWALLGARVTPGETGPAAFLVYTDAAGGRLSLFAARAASPIRNDQAGVVATVTKDGIGYAWMSDRGDWLERNGALLRDAIETVGPKT